MYYRTKSGKLTAVFAAVMCCFFLSGLSGVNEIIVDGPFVLGKHGFKVCYDGRLKQLSYVIEDLTKDSLEGEVNRAYFRIREDKELPEVVRSRLKDYKWSSYDRGHLVPAADYRNSRKAMHDSFLLSNLRPQIPQFNQGYWLKPEKYVREIVKKFEKATVISGPLFLPEYREDGRKYISYEVIGDQNVAVPTHFSKIILYSNFAESYIVQNREVDLHIPLKKFETTLVRVEKLSGIWISRKN